MDVNSKFGSFIGYKSFVNRFLQGTIRFEDGKWVQKMHDKHGKESMVTRWVDEKDQQQIVRYFTAIYSNYTHDVYLFQILECGRAKVHRFYKRM